MYVEEVFAKLDDLSSQIPPYAARWYLPAAQRGLAPMGPLCAPPVHTAR